MGSIAAEENGDTAMLTKSKIALAVALVLGTASIATAAPRHAVRHHTTRIERQVPASAYLSFGSANARLSYGSARPTGSVAEPTYMKIQDQGIRDYLGD